MVEFLPSKQAVASSSLVTHSKCSGESLTTGSLKLTDLCAVHKRQSLIIIVPKPGVIKIKRMRLMQPTQA